MISLKAWRPKFGTFELGMRRGRFVRKVLPIILLLVFTVGCTTSKGEDTFLVSTNEKYGEDAKEELSIQNVSVSLLKDLEVVPKETETVDQSMIFGQQVEGAKNCEDLNFEEATYREKCAMVMLWEIQNHPDLIGCFGMIDLTQDGIPELFVQNPSYRYGECVIYDISGKKPKETTHFWPGELYHETLNTFWYSEKKDSRDLWEIYKTVLPDGREGGILELVGSWKGKEDYYFCSGFEEGINALKDCIKIDEGYQNGLLGINRAAVAEYCLNQVGEGEVGDSIKALFPNTEALYWPIEEMTEEEFIESIQGSWLDTLRKLPRLPWGSPLVRTPDLYNPHLDEKLGWEDLCDIAERLLADYDQAVAEYDPISPITSGAPG